MTKAIYLMGALRNPQIPAIGNTIRAAGFDVFDDWFAPGPETDTHWRDYETARGNDYLTAINGRAATNTFNFDLQNLQRCDAGVLVLPAGRSAHLELGWMIGQGKRGYVLYDNPERWDLMYKFAHGVFFDVDKLIEELKAWDRPVISVSGNDSSFYQRAAQKIRGEAI